LGAVMGFSKKIHTNLALSSTGEECELGSDLEEALHHTEYYFHDEEIDFVAVLSQN